VFRTPSAKGRGRFRKNAETVNKPMEFRKWLESDDDGPVRVRLRRFGVESKDFVDEFNRLSGSRPNPMDPAGRIIEDGQAIVNYALEPAMGSGDVVLKTLQVSPTGTGAGSRFLKNLTDRADRNMKTLRLNAHPLDVDEPIGVEDLKALYRRFGFVDAGGEKMVRPPATVHGDQA